MRRSLEPRSHARVGDIAGCLVKTGYRQIKIGNTAYLAHRLAWFYVYGEWPEQLDHINRIKTDNRLDNIEEAHLCYVLAAKKAFGEFAYTGWQT